MPYEFLALPTSSQVPYELLALFLRHKVKFLFLGKHGLKVPSSFTNHILRIFLVFSTYYSLEIFRQLYLIENKHNNRTVHRLSRPGLSVCLFLYTHEASENELRKVTDPILRTGQIKIVWGNGALLHSVSPVLPQEHVYYLEAMTT